MQHSILIAAMITAYVEAGVHYIQGVEEAADNLALPDDLPHYEGRIVHATVNLIVLAIWPCLFIVSQVLAFTMRD